ncbi:hypothetical protein BLA24_18320 [Streptomyces cinnamoneus]|uniref:WXG100 family type VII secretion target n=1 Tax=Streptomyces cinnamoneus TaxID=53446 RepID=A0A2G1XHP0_STRCJ|nr:hypothetical protein [Streptomyces cinnamoneus]PHQ50737.1 hypothetical protein BLA24_18320 [Streptomyces cinnamoneus]PPT14005.1 hypothetical protein CYQ11_14955 [Streptomyces cinnamoneus]
MGEKDAHGQHELPKPVFLPAGPGQEGFAPAPGSTLSKFIPNLYDPTSRSPLITPYPGLNGPVKPDLKIEPKVLTGAAGKAGEIRTAFAQPAASLDEPTRAAAKGLDGMASKTALETMHHYWEEQAGTVAAWLDNIAQSLRLAANDYHRTNLGVKDYFKSSGQDH